MYADTKCQKAVLTNNLVHGQDLILGRFEETVELITLIAENDKKRERPIHRDGVLLERLDKAIELFTRLVQLAVES